MTHATLAIPGLDRSVTLTEGDTITDFRGTDWGFIKVTRGPSEGRSAKVKVSDGLGGTREFYASVFPGLEVIA